VQQPDGWVVYPDDAGDLKAIERSSGRTGEVVAGEVFPDREQSSADEIVLD
jgi:hypothetical protein